MIWKDCENRRGQYIGGMVLSDVAKILEIMKQIYDHRKQIDDNDNDTLFLISRVNNLMNELEKYEIPEELAETYLPFFEDVNRYIRKRRNRWLMRLVFPSRVRDKIKGYQDYIGYLSDDILRGAKLREMNKGNTRVSGSPLVKTPLSNNGVSTTKESKWSFFGFNNNLHLHVVM